MLPPNPRHPEWEALGFVPSEGHQTLTWQRRVEVEGSYLDLKICFDTGRGHRYYYLAVAYDYRVRGQVFQARVEAFEDPGEIVGWMLAVVG